MNKIVWKILLVDDDEDDYLLTRAMLAETQGVTTRLEWASTLEAGRKALQNTPYDAVLMDYDLGAGTGLELIREAAARNYPSPIILLTGRGSHEVDMEAMQAGATMYLTKTEANPLLLERVIRYAMEMKQKERDIKDREAHLRQTSQRLEHELTERQKVLKQLRESEEWLRLAFDATDLGFWQHDMQANMFIFDLRAQRHYGFDRNEVPFAETLSHIHPEDVSRLESEIRATIDPAGNGRYATEYRVVHPDGAVLHLAVQARVYFEGQDGERHPVLGVGTSQDITERKQSEEALARQSERQALLLSVTDWILKAGADRASLTRVVFDMVSDHLDVDVCFNYQIEQPSGPLKLIAGFGIPPKFWDASQRLELGQAFCGTVAATRQPLTADEGRIRSDEKGAFVREMGVRAYACNPLFDRSGRVLGTLSMASTRRRAFSADEVNFLQTLCHFIALAWESSEPVTD